MWNHEGWVSSGRGYRDNVGYGADGLGLGGSRADPYALPEEGAFIYPETPYESPVKKNHRPDHRFVSYYDYPTR